MSSPHLWLLHSALYGKKQHLLALSTVCCQPQAAQHILALTDLACHCVSHVRCLRRYEPTVTPAQVENDIKAALAA